MSDFSLGDVGSLGSLTNFAQSGSKAQKDTPESIAKAASQFEALLLGQLLKSAREGENESWMGTDANDAGSTLMEMSEQQLASTLAQNGGLGLAKMIDKGLTAASQKLHPKQGE